MLERNRRRASSTRFSQKRCQATLLLVITAMNLIGVAVLIVLFACHKAQEYRRNPPTFTSTLSFENLPSFPSSHFTRLTSDATQQFLRTRFFENHELPRGIWIFGDNLRTASCCEVETVLTPVYEEFTLPEPSPPSFTPPDLSSFEAPPSSGYNSEAPRISVTLPLTTDSQMNDYFTVFGVPVSPTESTLFVRENAQSGMFMAKLGVEKLFSNQIDDVVGPPSIRPSSAMDFEVEDGTRERGIIGPPSTVPNEAELRTLNEEAITSTTQSPKTVRNKPITEDTRNKEMASAKSTPSTKSVPSINNVLTATSSVPTTAAIFLDCSVEKDQHSTHNCQQWKAAGYCSSHLATKYIFCRRQCLCILP